MSTAVVTRGPLWAQPGDTEQQTLPLWRALLIALGMEIILPFLLLGVNWSAFQFWQEPPPEPVMSVRLEQPPLEEIPPPEPPKKQKPRREREIKQIPIVMPKPLPNEVQAKIVLPKLEPKPKPEPKPKEEEKPPEPVPEPKPEAQPLPSVFRDVKPVKKIIPKYPPEAEAKHIEGRVRVKVSVEVNGSVGDATIVAADPPGVFDAAVMEAVVQFIFKRDGTSYEIYEEFIFKLE
jgi:protein TonB